jgi:hypothetical protein
LVLLISECNALAPRPGEQPHTETLIADLVATHVAEENFWGFVSIKSPELRLILFVANNKSASADFDVLVILPEINETMEVQTLNLQTLKAQECRVEPAVIVGISGNSDPGGVEAGKYVSDEMKRFSNFVAHASKSEMLIPVIVDPSKLFSSDPDFRARRIEQIKSALGEFVRQRPLAIRIADFSRFTEQIEVLVPSRGEMYTMTVLNRTCSKESVEVGKYYHLKSIRPDLRRKIETHSTADVIRSGRKVVATVRTD